MLARGVDQILPYPGKGELPTEWVEQSSRYVQLAEQVNGPIKRPVNFEYIWGDTLKEFAHIKPDLRIINLECAVTQSDDYWEKAVLYRVNPANIPVLKSANIDVAILANNHILDWGYKGLTETVQSLNNIGVAHTGAGENIMEAEQPVIASIPGHQGRLVIFAVGSPDSGVFDEWAATKNRPGVFWINPLKQTESVNAIMERINKVKAPGDIIIVSVHWGSNWGYYVEPEHVKIAHALIDNGVDVIYGHSSHHVRPIEVYKDRLILYGCGDFIDDYEGISGHENFRGDLGIMYFPVLEAGTGKLVDLIMTPTQIAKMRVNYAQDHDVKWLRKTMTREFKKFGTDVELFEENGVKRFKLIW